MNEEKIISNTGKISSIASLLGSWQICHSLCLGLIAALGIIGVAVNGMPLLFLTELAVPFWTVAVILLSVLLYLYNKKKCFSSSSLVINSGLIITGTPFTIIKPIQSWFWIVGGVVVVLGITQLFSQNNKRCKHEQ